MGLHLHLHKIVSTSWKDRKVARNFFCIFSFFVVVNKYIYIYLNWGINVSLITSSGKAKLLRWKTARRCTECRKDLTCAVTLWDWNCECLRINMRYGRVYKVEVKDELQALLCHILGEQNQEYSLFRQRVVKMENSYTFLRKQVFKQVKISSLKSACIL